ncbi:hypothetical protein B0T26DRAFT_677339 [Lasiosphaeria miniovina]|uniref:Uncharacterized protein n=1 Tax=Lasiosphaeria miniovina TaxID=1954250 RepID=A0AA40DV63_9PEZI|nr:uncharacterized protein B0T26DRAFT_677339 [Lasiosphaeria miniovina]KAK0712938.1 hypothetical protein B0T26DRAFT_677339 [Lasiosphaeria miniovina]
MNLTLLSLFNAALLGVAYADIPFRYRFYLSPNCSHDNPAISTWPRINQDPLNGKLGGCYSGPTGTDWQRVELDESFSGTRYGVLVFCDAQCQGRDMTQYLIFSRPNIS